ALSFSFKSPVTSYIYTLSLHDALPIWISKYLAKHFQKISKLEEDLLRVPTTDEFFFLQSESSFNAFDFLLLIVKREPVKNCYASTYSISRRVIESLIELHDNGLIEQLTLFISDSMIKRNPITIDNLMAKIGRAHV